MHLKHAIHTGNFNSRYHWGELYTYRNSCPHVVYLVYRSSATIYIYLLQMTSWSPSCWLHIITLFTEPLITLFVVRLSEPLLLIAVDIGVLVLGYQSDLSSIWRDGTCENISSTAHPFVKVDAGLTFREDGLNVTHIWSSNGWEKPGHGL